MAQTAIGCQCRAPAVLPKSYSHQQATSQLSRKPSKAGRDRQPFCKEAIQQFHTKKASRCQAASRARCFGPCFACRAQSNSTGASSHNSDNDSTPGHAKHVCLRCPSYHVCKSYIMPKVQASLGPLQVCAPFLTVPWGWKEVASVSQP